MEGETRFLNIEDTPSLNPDHKLSKSPRGKSGRGFQGNSGFYDLGNHLRATDDHHSDFGNMADVSFVLNNS